jgi:hypothetical protein
LHCPQDIRGLRLKSQIRLLICSWSDWQYRIGHHWIASLQRLGRYLSSCTKEVRQGERAGITIGDVYDII